MTPDENTIAAAHTCPSTTSPRIGANGQSARSRIRRHPERSRPELADDILRRGRVAHVAFVHGNEPVIVPFAYHFEDGAIYLHGARASRAMRVLASGAAVCIEVTLLDGLVASRDAKSHSMNYRSVVVFGRAELIVDEHEKRAIFERMTTRYFSERSAGCDYLPARPGDLRAVTLLRVQVEELSAKSRQGPPAGKHDGADAEGERLGSCFVVSLGGMDV